ncbi:MAG: hypothetical protein HFI72_07580 [Peptococcaceae bacterium]|nr:hypothetical protein [Peptococcaceae bacterium]
MITKTTINKKIFQKILSSLLLVSFFWVNCIPVPALAVTSENTKTTTQNENKIYIRNGSDLIDLGKNCTLDTWSQNKIVELTSDIDLSAMDFTPIPSFGGTFRGNGHTISGLHLTDKGSYQGLFRYVQSSGKIENLTVTGLIAPEGNPKYLGGIAGNNDGTITYCTFNGTITGKSNVGGIAGYTSETGTITYCTAQGAFLGESYTGGITGQNFGTIANCQNHANVNTTTITNKKSLSDLTPDGEIDLSAIRSTENFNATTDTGGIAGFSKGKIDSCKNDGTIGYQHVGYNTGGICGRQSGVIANCENNGEIFGRKDVGGICGQAEPYIVQAYSKDALQQLNDTLRATQSTITKTLNRSDHEITDTLNNINQQLDSAANAADSMTDSALDYADTVITDTNDLLRRVSRSLDHMEKGLQQISTATVKLGSGIVELEEAGDALVKYLRDVAAAVKKNDADSPQPDTSDKEEQTTPNQNQIEAKLQQAEAAQREQQTVLSSLPEGQINLEQHIDDLQASIDNGTVTPVDTEPIKEDIGNIEQQLAVSESYLTNAEDILRFLQQQGYLPDDATIQEFITQLGLTAEQIAAIRATIDTIQNQLPDLGKDLDPAAIQAAIQKLQAAFGQLQQQLEALKTTLAKTSAILQEMKKHAPELAKCLDSLSDGLYDMERGMDYLTLGATELTRAIRTINSGDTLQIPEIDQEFRGNIDDLRTSLDNIQDQVSQLNQNISDTQDDLMNDFTTVNGQFLQILNILSDTYDRNQAETKEDFIEDVSDKNTASITQGKIYASCNKGNVQADINTGGIAGAMAIEYDFDPEDDVVKQGKDSLRFTYQTKAIIEGCQNHGMITGKKHYVGAIVGKMDLGTALLCEGYGTIESTDGSFVGGIAGSSDGFIRNSAAKCTLAGDDFVGGIAGQSKTITNCYAVVHISRADENKGAISGADSENRQDISQNYFVSKELGGIDGISYQGRAEAASIEDYCRFIEKTFQHQATFSLTYIADDQVIATLPYTYGQPIDANLIPTVPEKKGYFGTWTSYDYTMPLYDAILTAEYERAIEILPAALKRDGKAILLVCGAFDDNGQIAISENAEKTKIQGKTILASYQVTITNEAPKTSYQVRYLPLKKNSQIIIASGDTIQTAQTKPFGRYLECSAPGPVFTLYEVPKSAPLWLYAVIALLLLSSSYGVYLIKRKRQNKPPKKDIASNNIIR